MSNWIEEVEKRLYAKPDYKHHAQDRADIRRALRIIKRLREALEDVDGQLERGFVRCQVCGGQEDLKDTDMRLTIKDGLDYDGGE